MSTWDAARLASRRQLPKPRKMTGPVGEKRMPIEVRDHLLVAGVYEHNSCDDCGHHVCSCEPVDPYASYAKAADATLAPEIQAYLKYARFCAEKQRGVIPMVTVYGSDGVERHITVDELNREPMPCCTLCKLPHHRFMQCPLRAPIYISSLGTIGE